MYPQDPYNPAPQLTPVMPPSQPIYRQTDQLPQKHRRGLIVKILAILVALGAAGYILYAFLLSPHRSPVANAGAMHVGTHPYVNACNAFTAEDFESVVGAKSDRSLVKAEFAQETDSRNPGRSYTSTCDREGLDGLSITVAIHQYTGTKLTKDQMLLFGLSNTTADPELGGLTHYRFPKITFQKGNKVMSVLIQGYGDRSEPQIQALAKAAAKKISDRLDGSADLATLTYPSEVSGEGYVYQNACSLWGLDDFEKQFGRVDRTSVKMTYAEELAPESQLLNGVAQNTHSNCTVGTKEVGGSFAYVDTYYYPDTAKAAADYSSYLHPEEDIVLAGLGDKAVLKAYQASTQQYEKVIVLRGATVLQVQFVPENDDSRGNTQVQADIKAMAETVLGRLK